MNLVDYIIVRVYENLFEKALTEHMNENRKTTRSFLLSKGAEYIMIMDTPKKERVVHTRFRDKHYVAFYRIQRNTVIDLTFYDIHYTFKRMEVR